MENQFFNKVIELTVKGFINTGDFNINATKSLVNDLRQFVKIYESTNEPEPNKERKPRKKRNESTEESTNEPQS